jgi:hypothetical protein
MESGSPALLGFDDRGPQRRIPAGEPTTTLSAHKQQPASGVRHDHATQLAHGDLSSLASTQEKSTMRRNSDDEADDEAEW